MRIMKLWGVWILPQTFNVGKPLPGNRGTREIPGYWMMNKAREVFSTTSSGLAHAQADALLEPAEARPFDA
jgi:hypothetical protein